VSTYLGANLVKLRKEYGFTLRELGRRTGVHYATISNIERNAHTAYGTSTLYVQKLAWAFDLEAGEILLSPRTAHILLDALAHQAPSTGYGDSPERTRSLKVIASH
jgi:transcriptional regulator with XRE-family HTH domain